ncbi:LacI family DNA-binding transcriptional regulator [Kushneria phosphatilytica]|uniref:LacI family DNA-binding transcriptional regulator n=1 Tax=Kushneria phosphatilytica TaxID=657387 RepID=UPI00143CC9DD|nr:LacI family DNA-binding transcriptional regulator [Kushneria phosphatilytica]
MATPRQRRGSQRVTMGDVARIAGVSPSTVSLYLRRPDEVSEQRGQRIQAAVERLGYLPNTMAGGLASSRSRIIGVLVPTISNSFFAATLDTLEKRLREAGYQLLIGNTEFDEAREEELVRSMMSWSPAGLVMTGFRHGRRTVSMLLDSDIPLVEMWDYGQPALDMVAGFSHYATGQLIARHLLERGYRDTAFISPSFSRDVRAGERYRGFQEGMEQGGARVTMRELGGATDTAEAGALLSELMAERPSISAVFCANDMVALGVMFECQRRGWEIPGRLAVAGFGNLEFTPNTVPPLTTVEPPKYEIGRQVAELLLARLGKSDAPGARQVDLGVRLITREST